MDLKPKGGGLILENVDLCTIPYGAFDPRRGGGSSDPQTPPSKRGSPLQNTKGGGTKK